MSTWTTTRGALTGLALAAAAFLPLSGQSAQLGWSPWIGCWQAQGAPEDAAALCVRTSGTEEGAVEVLRVEDGQILEREVLWADGERHPTVREGCTGWEEGEVSRDGRRIFLTSSHDCEDGSTREGGGIMALATPDEWLDVRYLEVGGETTAWVQRYRPAHLSVWEAVGMHDLAPDRVGRIRGARAAAAQSLDVDDVLEASERVPPAAVEAWIAEKGDPFRLDAGVADRVIDVVVAVSNPDVFTLAADGAPQRAAQEADRVDGRYRGYVYDPFWSHRFRFSPYWGFGYSPFGYGGWGYGYAGGYGYGYGYRPTVIVVDRKDESRRPSRVIAGQGYRGPRVSGSSGGSAGGSGSSLRPAKRRPSGSSAAPSSRPSTSRPSSGSAPRKAKPRPKPKGGSGGGLF